ncbi:MAG: transposon-encoded TnpW family protein [Lachnospiraceae bacterium]|nr:transposon-encoded TnpW family protein [Lachnospiraceae bacterium]
MRKTIGGTTYIVTAHFSETSKETMSDKICRMIKRDIESGNY